MPAHYGWCGRGINIADGTIIEGRSMKPPGTRSTTPICSRKGTDDRFWELYKMVPEPDYTDRPEITRTILPTMVRLLGLKSGGNPCRSCQTTHPNSFTISG